MIVLIISGLVLFMSTIVRSLQPTVLVTGSTDGIGLTTAKNMAANGFHVIVHGRDSSRITKACQTIRNFVGHSNTGIDSVESDLSTIRGCEVLVERVKTLCRDKNLNLTVLMHNAGVFSERCVHTEDGIELTFAVNVLAPFIITSLLLPELLQQNRSRLVIASSISQSSSIRDWDDIQFAKVPYSAHIAYSESKLLDAMLAKEFADRLQAAGFGPDCITSNSLDPGTVNTKMLLAGWGPCGIDVEDALDETYLCTSDELEGVTGSYFTWRTERRSNYPATERKKMWTILSNLAPTAAAMWKFDWKKKYQEY
jgi:NAD(P)-dependent dehydrogenase (short-subunit alcohol dehydrogenase family)